MDIVWSNWTYRNIIIFRSSVKDYEQVFNVVQVKAWIEITSKVPKASFSYSNWCLYPRLCLKTLVR